MGYYYNFGLVFRAADRVGEAFIDNYLGTMASGADVRIDHAGDFVSVMGVYKADWDEEAATKSLVHRLYDEEIPFCLKVRGEDGELETDSLNPTEAMTNSLDLAHPGRYADLWVESFGSAFTPSTSVIPQVYVDLDTGTVLNGPIAKVPMDRLLDDMSDSQVIEASRSCRLWGI